MWHMVPCFVAQIRPVEHGMIPTSKHPIKGQTMLMNRKTSTAKVTELTIDQLGDIHGGLNALTVVAAIGLALAVDVAKAGVLVAIGAVNVASKV